METKEEINVTIFSKAFKKDLMTFLKHMSDVENRMEKEPTIDYLWDLATAFAGGYGKQYLNTHCHNSKDMDDLAQKTAEVVGSCVRFMEEDYIGD